MRADKNVPILIAALLVSLVVQLRFVLSSEVGFLASQWLVDDTFYYLQPAWLFKSLGRFTFDGTNPMYGFQPLWMFILTILARLTEDKATFLRLAIIGGSIIYSCSAILLYMLCRRWSVGWRPLIAPMVWLFNPDLISVYVTAKENALYAFLLILLIILAYRMVDRGPSIAVSALFGSLCGLIILARVNSIIAVLLLLFLMTLFLRWTWRERLVQLSVIIAVGVLVVLPWALYAQKEFGGIVPFSGVRKLIGAKAGIVHYLNGTIGIPLRWMDGFLSDTDRLFLSAGEKLATPSFGRVLFFLVFYVPAMSIGFGGSAGFKALYRSHPTLIVLAVLAIGCAMLYYIVWRRRSFGISIALRPLFRKLREEWPLSALILYALVNALFNGMLLPSFLFWGKWYAVPETLSCVLLFSFAVIYSLNRLNESRSGYGAAAVVAAILCINLGYSLRPQLFSPKNEYRHDAWEARTWMDQKLPSGARVGSWSAGLLGYFSDSAHVVNLDGLANTPEFVQSVSPNSILYELGVTQKNVMWEYIKKNQIRYIVDAGFDSTPGVRPFLGVIPFENYSVIYRSPHVLDWHESEGVRRFVILRLSYDISP